MKNFLNGLDISKAIRNNFLLKLTSLIIAILVWLYVSGAITSGGRLT